MAGIRVCVLGPAKLEVDGAPVRLTPLTLRLLVRLVAAAGEPLSVAALRHDVWGVQDPPRLAQRGRNEVQKRVVELRRAFDPLGTGEGTRVLATEQLFTGRAPESAYRLVLEPSQLDCAEFSELVYQALREPPVPAADKLARAVALWKGAPLSEAGDASYAAALTRRLVGLYETARRELVTPNSAGSIWRSRSPSESPRKAPTTPPSPRHSTRCANGCASRAAARSSAAISPRCAPAWPWCAATFSSSTTRIW